MILCKYTKCGSAAFMPHLDVLRAVGMCVRRKKLKVEFSGGFNPHMQLFFNQPLPIGTESKCEYFVAVSNENAGVFKEKLNESLPSGIEILKAVNLTANPNVAAIITESLYNVVFSSGLKETEVKDFIKSESFIISYEAKGESVSKEVSSLIKDVTVKNYIIELRVASGNVNLRADRVADEVVKKFALKSGYIVTKTAAYNALGKNIDELF